MSIKDRFAENFARSKTMSAPEKRANEIMGKLLLKKATLPLILMAIVLLVGIFSNINGWVVLGVNLVIAVFTFFYIKKSAENYQKFEPIVGNLISIEKKDKSNYIAIIKQGKMPRKLEIHHGGEDLLNLKKNQLVQVQYNPEAKIAIVVTR